MKERIVRFLKSIIKEIIVTMVAMGIIAAGSLLPASKPYFFKIFLFIQNYLIETFLVVVLILLIGCLLKIKSLSESLLSFNSKLNTLQPSILNELEKKISAIASQTKTLQREISSAKAEIANANDDIFYIKRDHLYRKAEQHQKVGQRGALLCRLEVIELDIKKNYDWKLEESLENLFNYTKSKNTFSVQDLSDIKNCLQKIKNEGQKEIVDQIIAQTKSKLI